MTTALKYVIDMPSVLQQYTNLSKFTKFSIGGTVASIAAYGLSATNPVTLTALIALGQGAAWLPDMASRCFRRRPLVVPPQSFNGEFIQVTEYSRRNMDGDAYDEKENPLASTSVDVALPSNIKNLAKAVFPLHRQIESQYAALPWPDQMKKIVVVTQAAGGRGDIAGAAKAIALMQKLSPTLTFDWVLSGAWSQYDPASFLHCKDILEAMNVFDGQSEPDYNQYSFNSGYAHRPASWGKFIDCVAIHEKNKHAVIVLNQRGEFAHPSTKEFQDQIFTPERLSFLKEKGYGTVLFKGQGLEASLLQEEGNPQFDRRLTVITRPSFTPSDMRCMQLASERLLATGDNSAAESWCARCKLYLYENVANAGCKWRFLQQQVDLAQTISPNLSKLLALFGGDSRLPKPFLNEPLSAQKMAEMEQLLNDPTLSDATLQLCNHITANYSFDEVLKAALKRAAWHHYIPELAHIEADALGEEFRTGLVTYLKDAKASEKVFRIRAIPELARRVQKIVQKYSY